MEGQGLDGRWETSESDPRARRWRVATGLALLAAAACWLNPFPPLAPLGARVARPPLRPLSIDPHTVSNWCLVGDFQGWKRGTHPMSEEAAGGSKGRVRVHTLEYTFQAPGRYFWKALPCEGTGGGLPAAAAWVHVAAPDQSVRFQVLTGRANRGADPASPAYYLDAHDGVTTFAAVGDFQGWNEHETLTTLTPAGASRYELRARVPYHGRQRARIVARGSWDGFGATGRTADPGNMEFTTSRDGEVVLIRLDGSPSRASVLYDIPRVTAWLAYGPGATFTSLSFVLLALLSAGRLLLFRIADDPFAWTQSGCPRCGAVLLRTHRRRLDRVLDRLGVVARRYRCGRCRWQGLRIAR